MAKQHKQFYVAIGRTEPQDNDLHKICLAEEWQRVINQMLQEGVESVEIVWRNNPRFEGETGPDYEHGFRIIGTRTR